MAVNTQPFTTCAYTQAEVQLHDKTTGTLNPLVGCHADKESSDNAISLHIENEGEAVASV